LKAATREYHEAIEVARRHNAEMIILAGLEWNIPGWGGDEHATVLLPDDVDDWNVLARFKAAFDDYHRVDQPTPSIDLALRWLEANATTSGGRPIVIHNHPSRKAATSMSHLQDLLRWRSINDLVIGFEGAPGHQGGKV